MKQQLKTTYFRTYLFPDEILVLQGSWSAVYV